jgi:hypothetical protein
MNAKELLLAEIFTLLHNYLLDSLVRRDFDPLDAGSAASYRSQAIMGYVKLGLDTLEILEIIPEGRPDNPDLPRLRASCQPSAKPTH